MPTNYDNILKQINKDSIVSFDVFDTLLLRPFVSSVDVFKYIEETYNCVGFAKKRIKAEEEAQKSKSGVSIEDIYSHLHEFLEIKSVEESVEKDLIFRNENVISLYKKCIEKASSVIIVSDIHFSKEYMADLLTCNGIEGWSDIYISSEFGKTKKDGTLFEEVLKKYEKNKLIHIGDNPISDYDTPKRMGIKAICIRRDDDIFLSHRAMSLS